MYCRFRQVAGGNKEQDVMNRTRKAKLFLCTALMLGAAGDSLADANEIPDEWESLDAGGLVQLAEDLKSQGGTASSQRGLLGEYISDGYMVDRASTRVLSLARWRRLGKALGKDLSAETRTLWGNKLREAFDDSAETREALSIQEMMDLRNAMWWTGHLNAVSHTPQLIQKVMTTAEWKSLAPLDLAGLTFPLVAAKDTGRPARAKLTEHLTSKYLANATAVRSMPLPRWRTFATRLGKDLSPETRALWISKLREAFAADQRTLESLAAADFRRLDVTLQSLEDKDVEALRTEWLAVHSSQWASMNSEDLAKLAGFLADAGHAGKSARGQLAVHVASRYLTDAASTKSVALHYWAYLSEYLRKELSAETRSLWAGKLRKAYIDDASKLNKLAPQDLLYLTRAMGALNELPKARELAMKASTLACQGEGSLAGSDPELLRRVALRLGKTLLCGKGRAFTGYAEALAELASSDRLDVRWIWSEQFDVLGAPLGTPESQQTVQAELIDDQGAPRPQVGHILSWAHYQNGTIQTWINFLDGKIAAEENADTRGRWFLARGFAEALSAPGEGYRPREAIGWFKTAHQVARTKSAKLECLHHLAAAYAEAAAYEEGLAFIGTATGQLGDAGDKKSVKAIASIIRLHRYDALNEEINAMRSRAALMSQKAAKAADDGDDAGNRIYLEKAERYRKKETELRNMMN